MFFLYHSLLRHLIRRVVIFCGMISSQPSIVNCILAITKLVVGHQERQASDPRVVHPHHDRLGDHPGRPAHRQRTRLRGAP